MDGYQVDIAELEYLESLVRELGRSFADSASLKYSIAASELGNDELARALTEFHDHSRQITKDLCADAAETASRLGDTAGSYERHDRASAELIAGLDDG